jgi:hypothetical protein
MGDTITMKVLLGTVIKGDFEAQFLTFPMVHRAGAVTQLRTVLPIASH